MGRFVLSCICVGVLSFGLFAEDSSANHAQIKKQMNAKLEQMAKIRAILLREGKTHDQVEAHPKFLQTREDFYRLSAEAPEELNQ